MEVQPQVCLVSMPYASLERPSMALGLLKAILDEAGIATAVTYANIWFADRIGLRRYELFAAQLSNVFLSGEWTFAEAAFGDDPRREEKDAEYLRQVLEAQVPLLQMSETRDSHPKRNRGEGLVADLWAIRGAATRFVEDAARRVLATGARVVGCTSTFEQHVASLALLRRIRELDPGVVTVLGGANCETVMGATTHRCFPWVDYVVSGEADGIVGPLCRLALERGREVPAAELPRGVLGPAHRAAGAGTGAGRPAVLPRAVFADLDSLPVPRFEDYFAALERSSLRAHVRPGLPVETSRGCWWGAVHQCTFCGLNGTGMGYRSKSAERVVAELDELADRHGISDFEAVDNILDMGYYKSLLPMLAADGRPRRLFYEIKANVSRAHIAAMLRAGITWVQPGIESLHSDVLKLMDKGIQGWQNIQLLKWSRELGMRVTWSILAGFPGEKDDWYADMAAWMPALEHLTPPGGTVPIQYDRFSVYHEQARKYGLILFPVGSMPFIYPVGPADLDGLAYYFTTEPGAGPVRMMQSERDTVAKSPGIRAVVGAVHGWREAHAHGSGPVLEMTDRDGVLRITDTRSCARVPRHELTGLARAVCLACDAAPRPGRLSEILARDHGLAGAAEEEIGAALDSLLADRLVLAVDGRLLGLALTAHAPANPDFKQFPGGHVLIDEAPVKG
jgi:ribosomal peptide maturation radical SAM protein 1